MNEKEFRYFQAKVTRAIKRAVRNAIIDHLQNGNYVVVMRNGKLTTLTPKDLSSYRKKSSKRS